MAAMRNVLAQIETRLQDLIEGSAAWLFPSSHKRNDLAYRLVSAMHAGTQVGPGGELLAPNLFTLRVHPNQAQALQANQPFIDGLAQTLQEAGLQAGLVFAGRPVIRVASVPEVPPGEAIVIAQNSQEDLSQTSDMDAEPWEDPEAIPHNTFLIVDGTQIVPLTQAVINIGRRSDNQLVIDDPRISRVHAQLRAVKGRYVIFDLDSRGGTFINGERVYRSALYPGDVISLSGVPLVFGQDPLGIGETQDYTPYLPDSDGR